MAVASAARLGDASPRCRVLLVSLLGKCRATQHIGEVIEAARSRGLALAVAAVGALGDLRDARGLDAVLAASLSPSAAMRAAAAGALALLGHAGPMAVERLLDLALDAEEDVELRRSALRGLGGLSLTPEVGERLAPAQLDDPLAVNILQLRLRAVEAAGGGVRLGADDIDRRLAAAIHGFVPARVESRHRDAIQALRTAEYFYLPGSSLPPGLDAAPPTIFWVKGLELWLDDLMRPMMRELLRLAAQREVAALAGRWPELRDRLAPGWRDDWVDGDAGDLFGRLGEDSAREFARPGTHNRVFGLRSVATVLLLANGEGAPEALGGLGVGLPRGDSVQLANRLVALAAHRNRFTHRLAGNVGDHDRVREVALACAGMIVRVRVGR